MQKPNLLLLSFVFFFLFFGMVSAQQDTVQVNATHETGSIGDTVCVSITTSNFEDITTFQFPILWDPTFMEFIEIRNEYPDLNFTPLTFGLQKANIGLISIVYFDQSLEQYTLPDGSTLFEVCFEIKGAPGSDNPVLLQNSPIVIEFVRNVEQIPHRSSDGSVTITSPDQASWVLSHCASSPGTPSGSITAECYGSVQNTTFEWMHETNAQYSGSTSIDTSGQEVFVDQLVAGQYDLQLLDSAGQVVLSDSMTIDSTGPFTAQLSQTDPSCANSADGFYRLDSISGGVAPYFNRWSVDQFLAENIDGLSNSIYTATIKDQGGCVVRDTANIFTSPVTAVGTVESVSCRDSSDGFIDWTFEGGSAYSNGSYNIFLNDSFVARDSVLHLSQLSPDTIDISVTDSIGCSMDSTVVIQGGRMHRFDSVSYQSTSCWDSDNGFITLQIETEGPSYPPYEAEVSQNITEYSLDNGIFHASGLGAGAFSIQITDQGPGNCSIDTTIELTRPDTIKVELLESRDDDCTDTPTGLLYVEASGGSVQDSGNYVFSWNNQAEGPINDSILSGQYSVTVTDTLGCEAESSFRVGNDQGPSIDTVIARDVLCYGDSSGRAEVRYTAGDTSIASVLWSDGIQDSIHFGLSPGTYAVTITDSSGCMAFATAEIEQPDSLSYSVATTPEIDSMMNGSIELEVFGGTPPYAMEWFQDSVPIVPPFPEDSLSAGTYTFHVTDQNGCTIEDSVTVEGMTTDTERPGTQSVWKLFPNPTNGQEIYLSCKQCSGTIMHWQLFGSKGRLIDQSEVDPISRSRIEIPVQHLKPGIYFLKWTLQDGRELMKQFIIN